MKSFIETYPRLMRKCRNPLASCSIRGVEHGNVDSLRHGNYGSPCLLHYPIRLNESNVNRVPREIAVITVVLSCMFTGLVSTCKSLNIFFSVWP